MIDSNVNMDKQKMGIILLLPFQPPAMFMTVVTPTYTGFKPDHSTIGVCETIQMVVFFTKHWYARKQKHQQISSFHGDGRA